MTQNEVERLVEAALTDAGSAELMGRARSLATTARDRQLVVIAEAYLAGDQRRVHDLAREHLADHPNSPLVVRLVQSPTLPTRERNH